MSILVLGTVALDSVKTPFGLRKDILGGSAVHFAMGARIFTRVNLVAIVGKDFPEKHIRFLHKKGIILTSLAKEHGHTFRWEGEYRGNLDCALTLNTELGVLSAFRPSIQRSQRDIGYIFLANVDPDIQRRLLENMRLPKLIGLDSMNYWIKHKRRSLLRLLKRVDIFVANEEEAKSLTGEHSLINAAKGLHCRGARMVLIKKGEHGVLLYADNFIFSVPAYPTARVIDPTGAGDTFAGGFMGYLAMKGKVNQANIKKAAAYGTVAASFNIEGFGVERSARLGRRDLEQRLKKLRSFTSF